MFPFWILFSVYIFAPAQCCTQLKLSISSKKLNYLQGNYQLFHDHNIPYTRPIYTNTENNATLFLYHTYDYASRNVLGINNKWIISDKLWMFGRKMFAYIHSWSIDPSQTTMESLINSRPRFEQQLWRFLDPKTKKFKKSKSFKIECQTTTNNDWLFITTPNNFVYMGDISVSLLLHGFWIKIGPFQWRKIGFQFTLRKWKSSLNVYDDVCYEVDHESKQCINDKNTFFISYSIYSINIYIPDADHDEFNSMPLFITKVNSNINISQLTLSKWISFKDLHATTQRGFSELELLNALNTGIYFLQQRKSSIINNITIIERHDYHSIYFAMRDYYNKTKLYSLQRAIDKAIDKIINNKDTMIELNDTDKQIAYQKLIRYTANNLPFFLFQLILNNPTKKQQLLEYIDIGYRMFSILQMVANSLSFNDVLNETNLARDELSLYAEVAPREFDEMEKRILYILSTGEINYLDLIIQFHYNPFTIVKELNGGSMNNISKDVIFESWSCIEKYFAEGYILTIGINDPYMISQNIFINNKYKIIPHVLHDHIWFDGYGHYTKLAKFCRLNSILCRMHADNEFILYHQFLNTITQNKLRVAEGLELANIYLYIAFLSELGYGPIVDPQSIQKECTDLHYELTAFWFYWKTRIQYIL